MSLHRKVEASLELCLKQN